MRALAGLWAVSLFILMGEVLMAAEGDPAFPAVEGKALTGEKFQVPASLNKSHNLLLLAFLREQQADIDTWIPRLEQIEESNPEFAFYEFPVLSKMNAMARWWIYHGMRSGIRSETARARTVTFHLDKEELRARLGIESENVIHIFLVDREGTILWRTSGRWSGDKQDSLMLRLNDEGPGGSGPK